MSIAVMHIVETEYNTIYHSLVIQSIKIMTFAPLSFSFSIDIIRISKIKQKKEVRIVMKKAIIISVILILFSGCAIEHPEHEPVLAETESIETVVKETYFEEVLTLEPIVEIIPLEELAESQEKPPEPPTAPQNRAAEPVPARTPEPTTVSNPQTPNPQIASPPTNYQAPPVQTPEPVYEPTPEPVIAENPPELPPAPQPPPEPPPVTSPSPARTICNTCGADITGNVPAHGTVHLLNGVSFSYRVE